MTQESNEIPEDMMLAHQLANTLKTAWTECMGLQVKLEHLLNPAIHKQVSKEAIIKLHIEHCELTRKLVEFVDDTLTIVLSVERD